MQIKTQTACYFMVAEKSNTKVISKPRFSALFYFTLPEEIPFPASASEKLENIFRMLIHQDNSRSYTHREIRIMHHWVIFPSWKRKRLSVIATNTISVYISAGVGDCLESSMTTTGPAVITGGLQSLPSPRPGTDLFLSDLINFEPSFLLRAEPILIALSNSA